MKVRRIPPVDDEVIEAFRYYKAIEPKLAERLTDELEACVRRIVHFPLGWKLIAPNLRQCIVKGFPYVVSYTVQGDEITVIAFANTHRRPAYWRERLSAL
jgi:plasmid stabilization system protein ParE